MSDPILSHTYPNGLVLVAEPMHWLRSAAFTFLVPAGCVYDPAESSGLSGFTCEMALRGAGPRDTRQIVLDLDNLGVERNESITDAHTGYSGATLAENLDQALAIYADVLRRPHLPEDELEPGRLAMLQELRAVEDEPAQKMMIELRRRYYPAPWGRPAQGEEAALESIDVAQIRRFVADRYQAAGTILGVAGHIQWEPLKELVGRLLGDWPAASSSAPPQSATQPRYEHLDYASNQTQIGIAYPSVPYRHPDYFQAWAAVGVLSGGTSSRLFTNVREQRGLCYSVYASYHTLRDRGGVFCYAGTGAKRAQKTLDVVAGELRRLAQGIEPAELSRLKACIKSSLIMQQESSASRSFALARDWYHLGRVRTLDEVAHCIDQLSCRSINRYLAANPPRDFTVVTLGPRKLEVPA